MYSVEGDKNEQEYISTEISILQCKALLFAIYSNIGSLQKASMGYLSELNIKPSSKNSNIVNKLKKINLAEEKQIYLLSLLSRLVGNKQQKIISVHPEYLFDKISGSSHYLQFHTPHTYKKSIISTDEAIFCDSLHALLVCISKVKNLNLSFRKREKHFVIKISADKLDWVDKSLVENRANSLDRFGLSLDQLIVMYSIGQLNSISVKTYYRNIEGRYSLNLRLPATSQLNVFD